MFRNWKYLYLNTFLKYLTFYLSNIFINVIVRSNCEYDYFGNVLEHANEYFPSYSSTRTEKVLVLEYECEYTSTITPPLA